ncbi:MAG: histidine phosphatase family protein [Armatimonadota bacterium]|nr:histidine phosphatase family protein [Armatimonadota bacterium]
MTRILLVRHGQTEWNRQEIFRGRADVPPSELGVRQAMAVAARLASEEISGVYSSPLRRAMVTAHHVAAAAGLAPRAVEDLTDMSYGAWEGQPHDRVRARYPDLYARWLSEPHRVRPPEGETLAEVRRRATDAVHRIAADHPNATVAVVSHRVVNKVLLCATLGLGDDAFWRIRQETGCLNVLEWTGDPPRVLLVNDVCHLRGLERDRSDF